MGHFPDISVLLVDDHSIVRKGCRDLLERARIAHLMEAADGEEAYRSVIAHSPDVVVMDLSMPRLSGLDTIKRISARAPTTRVVVFSMHNEAMFASRALHAGARCYVTKTSPPDELVTAVRIAAQGGRHLSHDIAQALATSDLMRQDNPLAALTAREFEIFRLVALGRNNAQIGESLSISAKSVSNAIGRIKEKLGLENHSEIVRIAMNHQLFET